MSKEIILARTTFLYGLTDLFTWIRAKDFAASLRKAASELFRHCDKIGTALLASRPK
jgi:hypothetical protein